LVGIVVVSHSETLAEGVVRLAHEMGGEGLAIEAAGGIEDADADHAVLGTDADRVRRAIERAMSVDGVLVLMDLGSALMSAEFAVEMLEGAAGPVKLSAAPLVEGAVAAAAAAAGGASLDEVAAEARGALAMKRSQIDDDDDAPASGDGFVADATAELEVRNAIGLHARPAARFVQTARGFDADVRVARTEGEGGRRPVSARSLTNLVALGARFGDTLTVSAAGPQAQAAVDALRELAAGGFGDGVVSAPPAAAAGEATRPEAPAEATRPEAPVEAPAEAPAAGAVLTGVAVSAGVAIGAAHRLDAESEPPDRQAGDAADETRALHEAIAAARKAIADDRDVVAARAGAGDAAIFDAHLALLEDDALLDPARDAIASGATAERAFHDAAQQVAALYRGLDEPLLRERATDVLDVGRRVVAAITGTASGGAQASGIVVADELTPADAAGLDLARVLAIATARGSSMAHAAILARALGLPAVVGLGAAVLGVADGTTLLLDGEAGTVTVDPPADVVADARERRERGERRRAAARARAHEPAVTRDGERIEVFANLATGGDAARAVQLGAEGVGLLRTEFLFLGRDALPGEEEQAETLRDIARALEGRPLIVRTLDAGADKPLRVLPMPPEDNPFLGVRGIRLTLARPEVLATQLRAILRVAAEHPVKTMLPMVATLAEITATRKLLDQARADTGIDAPMELGIMVEVPAAALAAARLAPHVDFFSLGTNDLTQYTMAAERGDARLAPLLAGPQPAVLRLVQATVAGAATHDRWVGVCGELAGDPAAAILLSGLGVTELSMAAALVPEAKAALRQVSLVEARAAARAALETDDADAARGLALQLL
jgi:multiphosphoryl transfer protein